MSKGLVLEWASKCNRGILASFKFVTSGNGYKCFCLPSYYGDFCQYQSQRVSLAVKLETVDDRGIYALLIRLIGEHNGYYEVNSFEQYTYITQAHCRKKLNFYFLYSQRPKNDSMNYSIQIDVYDKVSLTHIARWYRSITFLFLPVYRLALSLSIPPYPLSRLNGCNILCKNGFCAKYSETDKVFCRCDPGWSGTHCTIPLYCDDCSSDSLCIDSVNNRSICICRANKYGPRCLLTHVCSPKECNNNGQCILANGNSDRINSYCLCSEQYQSRNCEDIKNAWKLILKNVQIPSYIIVSSSTYNILQTWYTSKYCNSL